MSDDLLVIDTEIKGSASEIDALADAVRVVADALSVGQDDVIWVRNLHNEMSAGEFAARFDEWVAKLTAAFGRGWALAVKAVDVFAAYADQLRWVQNKMSDYRAQAREGHLVVDAFLIVCPDEVSPPLPEISVPGQGPSAQWMAANAEYEENARRRQLFKVLAEDVQDKRDYFARWVKDHLETLRTESVNLVDEIGVSLQDDAKAQAWQIPWGLRSERLADQAELYHSKALARARDFVAARATAAEIEAGVLSVGSRAMVEALGRSRLEVRALDLAEAGRFARVMGKAGGTVITVGAIGYDVATSDTPSTSLVGGVAGVSGGAAVGALLVTEATPIGWTIGITIAGSALASSLASSMYEKVLPLETRTKIDRGIREFLY